MPTIPNNFTILSTLVATLAASPALAAEPTGRGLAPKQAARVERAVTVAPPKLEVNDLGEDAAGAKPAPAEEAKGEQGDASLEAMRKEKERLELEQALERQRQERELSRFRSKKRAIESRLELDQAERKLELSELEAETARLIAERRASEQQLALEKLKIKREIASLETERELTEARRRARRHVTEDVVYRKQPFEKGVLYVTDRRIPLNGPITMDTADEITQKLHFFNNQSDEHPIFIVIDYSPGGSVMAGYRILEAMEASEAPVHVLVKSLAASMAAVITTRAEHSYAYPNSMILHHQISSGNGGNLTQQAERLAEAAEWSQRLLGPVHKKMGISHDELVKRMYAEDSDGDWKVFADEAVNLKWIDHVVDDVRETGVVELDGEAQGGTGKSAQTEELRDEHGRVYTKLPRLLPSDHWFLHNPDGYYR